METEIARRKNDWSQIAKAYEPYKTT